MQKVHVIGGGLAGCESAWQLSKRGIHVIMHEMRGVKSTPAHITDTLCELVCSNSFRSDDINNAVGLLHEEMRMLDSLILKCADMHKVPAGSALAVDRHEFANEVQRQILSLPNVELHRNEVLELPKNEMAIIATGPLTSDALSSEIAKLAGPHLAFFDAIAPIVYKDSINFDIAWMQSRYDKGDAKDYINCPLTKAQYYEFVELLIQEDTVEFKEWEKNCNYFNGCLPIEVMASRGKDVLRFGPMKPVGLTCPHPDSSGNTNKPYAVVQLRQDNKLGTLYNIVGFQTKLKYQAQERAFRTIPALENAVFARFGGLHRNTFINSPKLLDTQLRAKNAMNLRFAGQITGVEGYLESAAIGLFAGVSTAREIAGMGDLIMPNDTAMGALVSHIASNANPDTFQPMNVNYGLFPEVDPTLKLRGDAKKQHLSNKAINSLKEFIATNNYKI